jgi:aconitate hydratase
LKSYIQRDTYRILQHQITTTPELASALYKKLQDNISEFRKIVDRPLTLSEKILTGHLVDLEIKNEALPEPGKILLLL